MKRSDSEGGSDLRRKLAATAAAATVAVGGSAAARPAGARAGQAPRALTTRVAVAEAEHTAEQSLELGRRADAITRRHRLATALAAELDDVDASAIERGLASIDGGLARAYARGERPVMEGGFGADLARRTGIGEADLTAAFESMAANAVRNLRPEPKG